jgi:ribosome biogenesis GTPase
LYSLEELGWRVYGRPPVDGLTAEFIPARVAQEQRGAYVLLSETGVHEAAVSGRLMHEAAAREEFPAVGDWVLARLLPGEARAVIHQVLPRRTKLSRKEAG